MKRKSLEKNRYNILNISEYVKTLSSIKAPNKAVLGTKINRETMLSKSISR